MKLLKLIVLFSIAIIFRSVAQSNTISLDQAISICLENNLDIKIQSYETEKSANNNTLGNSGALPSGTLNIGQNNSLIATQPATASNFAIPNVSITDVFSADLSFQWIIYNGKKISINKKRLENLAKQSEYDYYNVVEESILNTIRLYYQALIEQEKLKVYEKALSLSRDRYHYAILQQEIGTKSTFESLQEKINYFTDSSTYSLQIITIQDFTRQLIETIGVDYSSNRSYTLIEEIQIPVISSDLDSLFQELKSNNYNLQKQYLSQEILDYDIGIKKSDLLPTVLLNFGVQGQFIYNTSDFLVFDTESNDFEVLRQTVNGNNFGPYINFAVSIPIFNGGARKIALENAKISSLQGVFTTSKFERSYYTQLSDAVNRYNIQSQVASLNKEIKENSLHNLNIANDRLQRGVINSFDYRQIQNSYLNAALSELQSAYASINAHTEILRLTGQLLKTHQ